MRMELIDGADMPEPYRRLLVHVRDMTPTLEAFHRIKIELHPLQVQHDETFMLRQVILCDRDTNRPVEYGAIRINLSLFEDEPRRLILETKHPLGGILRDYNIDHFGKPAGFFKVMSNSVINEAFDLTESQWLYGRCNRLFADADNILAEVVEILPPADSN